jgi:hypothetical protein
VAHICKIDAGHLGAWEHTQADDHGIVLLDPFWKVMEKIMVA